MRHREEHRAHRWRTCLNPIILLLSASIVCVGQNRPEPEEFLHSQLKLTREQIADIKKGKAVAKILPSSNPSDIFVFGAVYIRAKPASYLQLVRDINRLKKLSGYLGAGEFSKVPVISDMSGFSLDEEDVKDLRNCEPDDCKLQLPEESIEVARNRIDWNSPNLAQQVNDLAKHGIIKLIESYKQNGNRSLGTYRDKDNALPVSEHFRAVLSRVDFFPQYLPDLNRYLLEYPNFKAPGAQDFFYWEKVNFGLKPTVRINHGVLYQPPASNQRVYVIAIKQLYATHYFQTAIDLSFCVQGSGRSAEEGFYLMTLKASRQAGLTGFKGGLLRKVVISRTRTSLARVLDGIKTTLEHPGHAQPK